MSNTVIVITGSTRGIGLGLANSFLEMGCSVAISGRSEERVNKAVASLKFEHEAERICGIPCDVTIPNQIQALWDQALKHYGHIDIWINNAGLTGDQGLAWELSDEEVLAPIKTNLLGTIFGSQVAMRGMLRQGFGAIYNMEGLGSDGRKQAGLTFYGASKCAVHYFTESLALEAKGSPVIIGGLRPGMVITSLVSDRFKDRPVEWERAKKIFNIIADRVDHVTPWLAKRILVNRVNGRVIAYTTKLKLLWRVASNLLIRRDLFVDN